MWQIEVRIPGETNEWFVDDDHIRFHWIARFYVWIARRNLAKADMADIAEFRIVPNRT